MPKYALDANVYISAFRDRTKAAELTQFFAAFLSSTYLSAVVVQELRAGALANDQLRALKDIVAPFEKRGRLFAPSARAYMESGRVLADLAGKDGFKVAQARSSFINDVLIAASCRENGITLLTHNHDDFARIKKHLGGLSFAAPWPARSK